MTRHSTRGNHHRRGGSTSRSGSFSSSSAAADARAALQEQLLPQGNGVAERKAWFPPSFCCHPLSDQETIIFLKKTSDTSAMGLITLSIFYATYLLAWGKSGSTCIPNSNISWIQIFAASLPFAVFTLTVFVSGIVQAIAHDESALGVLSTACLIEFITAIALGGCMTFCMTGSWWMWFGILFLIVLMLLTWGVTFKHPKCLRNFIWSTCFRQTEVVVPTTEQRGVEPSINQALQQVVVDSQ